MKKGSNQQVVEMPAWHYTITWTIQENSIQDEGIESLQKIVETLVEQEGSILKDVKHTPQTFSFQVSSTEQLNITKWQTALQKKVMLALKGRIDGIELEHIISHSQVPAAQDQRLGKLIESIREVDYYDLEEGLTDEDCAVFKGYLKEQRLSLIEQKGQLFLIDNKALRAEINLNCFECTKRHQYGCCCGSPCAMSDKNMNLLDRHLLPMEEALKDLDEKQYQTLIDKGGFVSANGEIKAFDGHCAFLIWHEGVYKCMAHKYALDQNMPIYELCPLSCLMYPLEILECITDKRRKLYVITSAVDEPFAARFSRWGSYTSLDVELRCIRKECADEGFKEKDYQPVYEVNKGLLAHEFGEDLYKALSHLLTQGEETRR